MKPNLAFTITDHHGHFVTSTGYDEQGDKVLKQLSLSTVAPCCRQKMSRASRHYFAILKGAP
jgi:hypothetical protein